MKCRTCEKEGTRYMPNTGEHYCLDHAPLGESQVPAGAGWDPDVIIESPVGEGMATQLRQASAPKKC